MNARNFFSSKKKSTTQHFSSPLFFRVQALFLFLYSLAKVYFSSPNFQKLAILSPMYKNYNFGPLRFSPFASLVFFANFDQSMPTWHATCVIIELKKIKNEIQGKKKEWHVKVLFFRKKTRIFSFLNQIQSNSLNSPTYVVLLFVNCLLIFSFLLFPHMNIFFSSIFSIPRCCFCRS